MIDLKQVHRSGLVHNCFVCWLNSWFIGGWSAVKSFGCDIVHLISFATNAWQYIAHHHNYKAAIHFMGSILTEKLPRWWYVVPVAVSYRFSFRLQQSYVAGKYYILVLTEILLGVGVFHLISSSHRASREPCALCKHGSKLIKKSIQTEKADWSERGWCYFLKMLGFSKYTEWLFLFIFCSWIMPQKSYRSS